MHKTKRKYRNEVLVAQKVKREEEGIRLLNTRIIRKMVDPRHPPTPKD
jgi:hypothetical protein